MPKNNFDRDLFNQNLDLLRKSINPKLRKQDFSNLLGVTNAYRKDAKGIGKHLFRELKKLFPEIDESWLLTPHPEGVSFIARETASKSYSGKVDFTNDNKNTNIDLQNSPRGEIIDAVLRILDSGDKGIINALVKNIQEFARAVETKKQLENHEKALQDLRAELAQVRAEMDTLKKSITKQHHGITGQAAGA